MTIQAVKVNDTFFKVIDQELKACVGYVSHSPLKKTWNIYTKEGNFKLGSGSKDLSVALDKAKTYFASHDFVLQEEIEELMDYGD